jgi:uncharacterized phage-associated protein
MADWSPAIANEFIRLAAKDGRALTQMQLQKLVYIAHGWNLAINSAPLTLDDPQAWEYGPVYRELHQALRHYGRSGVTREIKNEDFTPGIFDDEPSKSAVASLSENERALIQRVYNDYGRFHAFQLSALTHRDGTPWTAVYANGAGRSHVIPPDMIRNHFVELAQHKVA